MMDAVSTDQLTVEMFTGALETAFHVENAADISLDLKLLEATPVPSPGAPNSMRHPFSLVFKTVGRYQCPQGTYRLHHEALGILEIFLVPIGLDEAGTSLQAVFS